MKLSLIDEPELQFADGTHVDVRAGIAAFGTLDRGDAAVPVPIRVGLVGSQECADGVAAWLDACSRGIAATERRLRDLRPKFPGMTNDAFGTTLELKQSSTRAITRRELAEALAAPDPLREILNVFFEHARDVTARGGIDVLVIAPPVEVFAISDGVTDEAAEDRNEAPGRERQPDFHDVFKARALELPVPCQIVRPDTYGGGSTRRAGRRQPSLQDEATRAWNFHTALYYKAGGVPWRLVRDPKELTSCYVGLAFFESLARDRLLTSVAQVFNERGEGVVVQGGNARVDKEDRTPHLNSKDACELLVNAVASYRREHKTTPARLVVHKTSVFDQVELDGCRAAAKEVRVELLELISIRRGGTRLLRTGTYPVLRGTTLAFDDASGLVYLRGSVPQFRTYPGMYVPSSLEFIRADGEASPLALAREILELSKLNFNNTQFDGGQPITIRAARRVGDILKRIAEGRPVQSRFRFFT